MSNNKYQAKTISLFTAGTITTISITLVLVLLGLTVLVSLTNKSITNLFKENFGLTVELPSNTTESKILQIKKELEANPYIKSINYISKDEVKRNLIAELGTDPEDLLGFDPSVSFFDIYIKGEYVDSEGLALVKQSLKGLNLVENIKYGEEDIKNANNKLAILSSILFMITILLVIISFVLIRSIIQLNIYSKRFLINTMQLVGATNSFIRRPFMWRMILSGIISSLVAGCIILGILYYLIEIFPNIVNIITIPLLLTAFGIILTFGIFISATATASTVNKYLRMDTDRLYKI